MELKIVHQALAAANEIYNPALPDTYKGMSGPHFLQQIIEVGITFGFVVGCVVFLFMLIAGAIKWITSKGETWDPRRDPGPLVQAQKQITNALVGLAILFCIYAIIRLISKIFGVDFLKFNIPTLS